MCGIFGTFNLSADLMCLKRLEAAKAVLLRRGPDSQGLESFSVAGGTLSLGHTRLSIIDLSANGHQPMHSPDGRYVIIFNGEIYNYQELRQELKELGYQFRGDADTEVLLVAWACWGKACLPRLVGMFAFVVFDRHHSTLTCVRDAFGIKPFFYAQERDDFLFASEVAALLALKGRKAELNWQKAYDYLVHGDYDSGPQTFYVGILNLSPGHLVHFDLKNRTMATPARWWSPSLAERHDLSFTEAAELVRQKFLESIRLHLRSDVPVGAALSGGIDSSAVVCAIRHVQPERQIHTFSFVAENSDVNEEHWADAVNRHVDAVSHKVVVSAQELAEDLEDMIQAQGEPFGSTSIYAQYRVYQLAREHGVTVTLDGQGADEMLGGYVGYPGQRIHSLLEAGRWMDAARFLDAWSRRPGRSRTQGLALTASQLTNGFCHQILRSLSGRQRVPSWINGPLLSEHGVRLVYPLHRPSVKLPHRHLMAELANSLTNRGLSSLLRHGDRNSMRFSVESRVPFLTVDQVDTLLCLPEEYLVSDHGETKSVFRAGMRGIVPDEILDRQDKIGFQTPERSWLAEIENDVREWLSADIGLSFLNQSELSRRFDAISDGRAPFSSQTWRWINFIRWYQLFLM